MMKFFSTGEYFKDKIEPPRRFKDRLASPVILKIKN